MFKRRPKDPKGFEAFPAVLVADQTNKFGKRLGQLALGLMILFFVISSYVQSAKNGRLLDASDEDRRKLIISTERMSKTLNEQTMLIIQLQDAVNAQNKALRDAGIAQVPVPKSTIYIPRSYTSSNPSSTPSPTPSPSPTSRPKGKPSARPSATKTSPPACPVPQAPTC